MWITPNILWWSIIEFLPFHIYIRRISTKVLNLLFLTLHTSRKINIRGIFYNTFFLSKWQRNKKTRFVQIVFLSPNSLISMVCNNTKSGYQIWIFPDKSSCSGNCKKYRFDSNRICLAALIILYHGTATQVVSITPFWPMHLKERIYEGLISFLTFFSQSILW